MKRDKFCLFVLLFLFLFIPFISAEGFLSDIWGKITGKVVSNNEMPSFGPSASEQECMMSCMGCSSPGVGCTGNSEQCQSQCNVKKPEQNSDEKCVEECVAKGCEQYDFVCQEKNRDKCDEECGMLGDAPDESTMSEEQKCITNCVNLHSPGTRCKASQEGETGNDVCQMCAKQCEHLYAGPCLNEEKLEEKKKECETCEHCYGEPLMGASGEGWDCIIDVECKDASGEFGDDSGTGPGIVETVGNAIGNTFEGIVDFFKEIF